MRRLVRGLKTHIMCRVRGKIGYFEFIVDKFSLYFYKKFFHNSTKLHGSNFIVGQKNKNKVGYKTRLVVKDRKSKVKFGVC